MNRFTFIFIVCLYALFIVYQANSVINLESQIIYSSFFILLFGIPHGAIDHILFFRKKHMSQIQFYSLYLGLIGVFAVSWIFFQSQALSFFWCFPLFTLENLNLLIRIYLYGNINQYYFFFGDYHY